MSAYARCPRQPAYSSLDQIGTSASELQVAEHRPNNSTNSRKNSKWKPLDYTADAPEPADSGLPSPWGEPFPSTTTDPHPSHFDPPKRPKNSRPSNRRPPKKKMASETADKREYVPPHRRNFSSVPPHLRNRISAAAFHKQPADIPAQDGNNVSDQQNARPLRVSLNARSNGHARSNGPNQRKNGQSNINRNGAALAAVRKAPPSPPDSTQTPPKEQSRVTEEWGGWAEHELDAENQGSAAETWERVNGNEQKTKARRSHWPKPRESAWPKNSDMKPRPDDEESDGGVEVSKAWDELNEREGNNEFRSPLQGWDGAFAPPDVDRQFYQDPEFNKTMDKWLTGVCMAYRSVTKFGFLPHKEFPYLEHWTVGTEGDVAERRSLRKLPRAWNPSTSGVAAQVILKDWIPVSIEGESLQEFWRAFPARAPDTVSDIDLNETTPWWETLTETHCLLPEVDVPDAKVDPSDEGCTLPNYHATVESIIDKKYRANEERVRRIQAKRNRSVIQPTVVSAKEEPFLPTANIYIRPILPADVVGITDLYNHYVKHTVYVNEFKERTLEQMSTRMQQLMSVGLPWIVAVLKTQNRRGQGRQLPFGTEKIVGFASVDDYCDVGSMYRFTYELEMFVHHEYLHKGIGKCLLDRMVALVHPGYMAKGGYEWLPQTDYLKHGCGRVVKVVNFSYPHANDQGDREKLEWLTQFTKHFGFRRAGHMYGLGYKLDKCVDVCLFQMTTSEIINAGQGPMAPL